MSQHYEFENKPLPYPYDAMEPYIDTRTMELHHDKHLQTYVDNLNRALMDHPRLHHMSLEDLIISARRLPKQIQIAVSNNAGGVYNHCFFFEGLSNTYTYNFAASGAFAQAVNANFGSLEQFKTDFKAAALSVFGSGYAWLVADRRGRLLIITTANQSTPLTENLCPILNIDVWEHAYYLKNQNRRGDYIGNWFHVVNWERAARNFAECRRFGDGKQPAAIPDK